jgi:flagellar protein FlbT
MLIGLKGKSKIYINGAVLSVDRRVNIELLNDATFLLENHVLQLSEANTPLRQLYFCLQTALMEPAAQPRVCEMVAQMLPRIQSALSGYNVPMLLREVAHLVASEKYFEALKTVRSMYAIEADVLLIGK